MRPLNMCWECPRCGTQIGQPDSGVIVFTPPGCSMGHPMVEMEQRTADRFGVPYEDSDPDA